jgi:hypothetical protein
MGSSTTAERQPLASTVLLMLPSTLSTVSASALCNFRGPITHPTQSLCTLRCSRRRIQRNTRYQADATPYLGRSFTCWITPASPDALTGYSTFHSSCACRAVSRSTRGFEPGLRGAKGRGNQSPIKTVVVGLENTGSRRLPRWVTWWGKPGTTTRAIRAMPALPSADLRDGHSGAEQSCKLSP